MIYRVNYPNNPDGSIGSLIGYISICDQCIGDARFLYYNLIKNNVVPKNWFLYNELHFTIGLDDSYVIRRRITGYDVLYVIPITQAPLKLKKPKPKPYYRGEPVFLNWDNDLAPIWQEQRNIPVPAENPGMEVVGEVLEGLDIAEAVPVEAQQNNAPEPAPIPNNNQDDFFQLFNEQVQELTREFFPRR